MHPLPRTYRLIALLLLLAGITPLRAVITNDTPNTIIHIDYDECVAYHVDSGWWTEAYLNGMYHADLAYGDVLWNDDYITYWDPEMYGESFPLEWYTYLINNCWTEELPPPPPPPPSEGGCGCADSPVDTLAGHDLIYVETESSAGACDVGSDQTWFEPQNKSATNLRTHINILNYFRKDLAPGDPDPNTKPYWSSSTIAPAVAGMTTIDFDGKDSNYLSFTLTQNTSNPNYQVLLSATLNIKIFVKYNKNMLTAGAVPICTQWAEYQHYENFAKRLYTLFAKVDAVTGGTGVFGTADSVRRDVARQLNTFYIDERKASLVEDAWLDGRRLNEAGTAFVGDLDPDLAENAGCCSHRGNMTFSVPSSHRLVRPGNFDLVGWLPSGGNWLQ